MKIALISFGHTDVALDWCRALAGRAEVDLWLAFSRDMVRESVVELNTLPEGTGPVPEEEIGGLIDSRLEGYLGGAGRLRIFLYDDLKFRNPKNLLLSRALAREVRRGHPDVVHFSGNDLRQWQVEWFLGGLPRIHGIHDYRGHSGERRRSSEWFNRRLVRGERVLVHSDHVRREILGDFPEARVREIPFGPLDVYRRFLVPGRECLYPPGYVLFFGRVSAYKGVGVLAEAARRVFAQDPGFRLVIAGSGDWKSSGCPPDGEPGISTLPGRLGNAELAALVEGCAYVVCPYLDATQSGVVMAAYAFGKPVLATSAGGLQEAVEEGITGWLVPPGNVGAMARAMSALHRDPGEVSRCEAGVEALRREGPFCWDAIAKRALEVYGDAARKQTA